MSPDLRPAIVGAPAYFESHAKPASPRDLLQHRCIRFRHRGESVYKWELDKGNQSLEIAVNGSLIIDELDLVIEAAIDGAGLAWVAEDPDKLSKFFVSNASAPLAAGQQVTWKFADVGGELVPKIETVERDKRIVFAWEASGQTARVEIELAPYDERSTKIHIVESAFPMNAEGVQRALEQAKGWTDLIDCMRAYLEFGVRLRQGRTKDLH